MADSVKPLQALLDKLTARLARVEATVGIAGSPLSSPRASTASASSAAAPAPVVAELAPQIVAYDAYVAQHLPTFVDAAAKLGDEPKKLAAITERAFAAQRAYLVMASQCKKPVSPNPEHLKDLQACLKEINALRDNRSEFAHHQNMVNEGIQALGWVCVEPAPKPFIESYIGGSDFWGNKIRVQFKATNPDQVAFVTAFKALLTELMAHVKAEHTTGVTWNPRGSDAAAYTASAPAAAAPAAAAKPAGAGLNDIFAGIRSIDQSSGKTAGLRQVAKEQQTWRKEYQGGAAPAPVPAAAPKPAAAAAKPAAPKVAKPPVCEQRNGNWQIEYQTAAGAPLTVSDITMKQQVYIFGCDGATIVLAGKAKNIVLDSCKKTKLVFDDAVSSIEVVNCKNVQVQSKGRVPSVAIDKTDGCLVYISWEGRDVQFVTSKSSEMNVAFPAGAGSDEYIEKPIPEQFVHRITADHTITSDVSDLYTH